MVFALSILVMTSLAPEAACPPALIQAVVSSYHFPTPVCPLMFTTVMAAPTLLLSLGIPSSRKFLLSSSTYFRTLNLLLIVFYLGLDPLMVLGSEMIPLGSVPVTIPLVLLVFPPRSLLLHKAQALFLDTTLRLADRAPTRQPGFYCWQGCFSGFSSLMSQCQSSLPPMHTHHFLLPGSPLLSQCALPRHEA